ncbi:MAG: hypothetical protein R2762_21890 [Bryobacteraceae bacterium]
MKVHNAVLVCVLSWTMSGVMARAQPAVSPLNWGERVLVVVPMVGSGSGEDPRRPLVMPRPGQALPDGVMSMRFEESDDGKTALVEVVARDRQSLTGALAAFANRADVKRFDKGKARKEDIEAEFRGKRRDFDLDRFVLQGAEGRPDAAARPGR